MDVTLLTNLDQLLHKYPSMSPVIRGDFNVHESTWLHSSHTSSTGTATLDFCESRGLCQLVNFPNRLNAILDLVLTEHPSSIQTLLNLNASDHVVVLVTLLSFTNVITPVDRLVYHWSHAPLGEIKSLFCYFCWHIPNSVDAAVSYVTNVVVSATQKFVPSCIPRLSQPLVASSM